MPRGLISLALQDPITICEEGFSDGTPTELYNYRDRTIRRWVNSLSTILASLIPTASILVLYFVQSEFIRLLSIVIFTVLFSLVLTLVARAGRVETFAATST